MLSLQDIKFLLEKLSLSKDLRGLLNELISRNDKLITDNVADELRDLCTDRLDTHGFDVDYNPTEEGKILEILIDKLYAE